MVKGAKTATNKPRRLKVFTAEIGFFESVVAVPNQAEALRAWGVHQNLFAGGDARIATDEDAIAAALANPGTPLRRAIGGAGAFSVEPDLPTVKSSPPRQVPTRAAPAAKAARPAPPDRSALAAAEEALRRVDEAEARERAVFDRRRRELEAEATDAKVRWRKDRQSARKRLDHERRAYRQAGGEP